MNDITTNILIAEDDFVFAANASDAIENAGHNFRLAKSTIDAKNIIMHEEISAAILDYELKDGTTESIIRLLNLSDTPYAIVTNTPKSEITSKVTLANKIYRKPANYELVLDELSPTFSA